MISLDPCRVIARLACQIFQYDFHIQNLANLRNMRSIATELPSYLMNLSKKPTRYFTTSFQLDHTQKEKKNENGLYPLGHDPKTCSDASCIFSVS